MCPRFIPSRSGTDMDYLEFVVTGGPAKVAAAREKMKKNTAANNNKGNANQVVGGYFGGEAYQKALDHLFNMDRTTVFSFNPSSKNPNPNPSPNPNPNPNRDHPSFLPPLLLPDDDQPRNKKTAPIPIPPPPLPTRPQDTFLAANLADDILCNPMDWGSQGVLALALEDEVEFYDPRGKDYMADHDPPIIKVDSLNHGAINSIAWAPDGRRLALGLSNLAIQVWDAHHARLLSTLRAPSPWVGSLAWRDDNHLSSGGSDGTIRHHDVRCRRSVVTSARPSHRSEVCALRWSDALLGAKQLASGGADGRVRIWDLRFASNASTRTTTNCIHTFDAHVGPARALAWSPFDSNLIATGGADAAADKSIKFFSTAGSGSHLESKDTNTGGPVYALQWGQHDRQLLSANRDLTLWKYPSMAPIAKFAAHTTRALYLAQSPDGCNVASAAGFPERNLRFWKPFRPPPKAEPRPPLDRSFIRWLGLMCFSYAYLFFLALPSSESNDF